MVLNHNLLQAIYSQRMYSSLDDCLILFIGIRNFATKNSNIFMIKQMYYILFHLFANFFSKTLANRRFSLILAQ